MNRGPTMRRIYALAALAVAMVVVKEHDGRAGM